jgi:hypothetical protein
MTQPIEEPFTSALNDLALPVGPTPALHSGHDVQFYRTELALIQSATDFLADGLRAGQPIVVIATEPHRRAFADRLRARGLDTDEMLSGREAIWLDARETLSCFMEGRTPNRELFLQTVGAVFERLLKKRYYLVVRGYGEMVDLLVKEGNVDGAVLLEAMWNELADKYSFALLCGYSMDNFLKEAGAEGFRQVCSQHSRVVPLEPFRNAS